MKTTAALDLNIFVRDLAKYKKLIDADIKQYSKQIEKSTLQSFGTHSRLATDAYLSILGRGGKRIRGALVMLSYEMLGGKDRAMIIQAARAVEMMHAYILIVDDIQDRSAVRRGGKTANVMLADYHSKHSLADDPDHFGVALALNAALGGAHAAGMILANLDAREEDRLKVISIMNRTMLVTTHGQTNDIMNEVVANVDESDVDRVLEWKTAHYTFLNPLHVGMVLAGADCHDTDGITDYAMHAGRAFQITDDILGIFGNEFESGKSPMDDLREGKRTLLSVYALKHALNGNKNFLLQMLGNRGLTPAEFERCKDILQSSGALEYAQSEARRHVTAALKALESARPNWSREGVSFLNGLAQYLLTRSS